METVSLTEARGRLGQLVNQVALRDDRVVIERHGSAAAVLVSPEAAALLDRLEDLIDIELATRALEDARVNGTISYDEFAAKHGL